MNAIKFSTLPIEVFSQVLDSLDDSNKWDLRLVSKEWNTNVTTIFLNNYRLQIRNLPDSAFRNRLIEILCSPLEMGPCSPLSDLKRINLAVRAIYRELGVEFLTDKCSFIFAEQLLELERSRQKEHDAALTNAWPAMYCAITRASHNKIELPSYEASAEEIRNFSAAHPSRLASVRELRVSQRGLNSIPLETNYFMGLTSLSVPNNQIQGIPNLFLPALKYLDVSMNNISVITNLGHLPNLTTLVADSNQISVIEDLNENKNLEKIFICVNKIVDLSPLFGLPNLKEVFLQDNQIDSFPYFSDAKSLSRLELAGNPFPLFASAVDYHTNFAPTLLTQEAKA